MARKKGELSVIKVREILRLKEMGLSNRLIGESCRVSASTVWEYVTAARECRVVLKDFESLSDVDLLKALGKDPATKERLKTEPDYRRLHQELSRKGVTLQLLWEEYAQECPDGYKYSRFCELYDEWLDGQEVSMPQRHRAAEKLFVDYAGQTVPIIDQKTRKVLCNAAIFVATFGASNFSYVEATAGQTLPSWLGSHVRAFTYFGGLPEIVVPDNLKSGVKDPLFYEPEINRAYQELASHYGVAIIPARVRKPRDKAKVENAVQNVSRRLLAPLRDRTFYSLADLNAALREALNEWSRRTMAKYGKSRQELFDLIDKPALRPLPQHAYEFAAWKKVRVNIDYHFEFDHAFYSVPFQFVHVEAFARATEKIVELYIDNTLVARHPRQLARGAYSTITEHMPPQHRFAAEWTPERLLSWAKKTGPHCHDAIARIIASKPHPQQGFRAALGVLRLAGKYTHERVEAACAHVNELGTPSFRRIKALLDSKAPEPAGTKPQQTVLSLCHSNVRGRNYYH